LKPAHRPQHLHDRRFRPTGTSLPGGGDGTFSAVPAAQ
jgi:hypothetical protein